MAGSRSSAPSTAGSDNSQPLKPGTKNEAASHLIMEIGRAQKRVTLYVILPAALVYLGLRFYAQFRHVDLYVSRVAPIPAELAAGLHMEEHKIDSSVRIESPYDSATDKILPSEEIRRLRTTIAWSSMMPAFIDSLTIVSPTNAIARQNGKRFMREYELNKQGDRWIIARATRSKVNRFSPE
jgi:hypothetical protein